MENEQPFWKAKTALTCYLTLAAGILVGGIALAIILLGAGLDYENLTFPVALISLPVNEVILLIITILFARQNGANLKQLGLKKPSLKTLTVVSLAAVLLLFLAGAISTVQETIVGPDPEAELLVDAVLAQDLLQLVALVGISVAIVGPVEELAFRGFVQRGLENSYGPTMGLIFASVLFGLLHGLNSWRSIIPVTIVSLFLGYVWQKTDKNTTAVGWMHGLYDAIAIIITYFAYA
jgi:membrane protease YdiL (CAAX protease family)